MNTTQQILKTCWQHAWKYPKYVIALLIMAPFATIMLRLVPPLIIASVLNRLTARDYTEGDVWGSFGNDILLYALVSVIGGIVAWRVVILIIWRMEGFVVRDIYRRMFNKFMELDANYHANNFGGSLVSQTNKFVGAYIRLQDTFVFQVWTLITSFAFISVMLYPKAPAFVWALWGFSVVFITFALMLSKSVRAKARIEAASQNKVTGYLADAITNVMAIKSYSARKDEQKRFAAATEETRHRTMDVMWATTWRDVASSSVTSTIGIAALIAAVIAVVNHRADIGLVFLLVAYTGDISERLWELSSTALRTYNRAIGDSYDAIATLNTQSEVTDPVKPKKLTVTSGGISFANMTFTHGGQEDALFNNFDLEIQPGTKVGLVGHSGSGKTTLTRLLLRYSDIDSGAIAIDGQDISKTTQDDLRSHIAYVPQEPMLFHRSLKENIGYGDPTASDKAIAKAAELANATEFIDKLPDGYSTLVGERGVKLSGGQRQRIAIARAMLKDAPILVLDEATSALDSESEVLIQDALWKLMENKTAIVVAHRLSTIQKMDQIIILDDGKIVEHGSHKQLLDAKGAYAKLWAHQSGGFIED